MTYPSLYKDVRLESNTWAPLTAHSINISSYAPSGYKLISSEAVELDDDNGGDALNFIVAPTVPGWIRILNTHATLTLSGELRVRLFYGKPDLIS